MIINEQNFESANNATRDILYMYRDLIESYSGFGHGIDTGSYDPFAFARVELNEPDNVSLDVDSALLKQGSAIAIICWISDAWDESDPTTVTKPDIFVKVKDLILSGELDDYPVLKQAIAEGIKGEKLFRTLLPDVFKHHVVGYFEELLSKAKR